MFIRYGCKENATYGKADAVRKHPSKGYVKTYCEEAPQYQLERIRSLDTIPDIYGMTKS